MRKAKCIYYHAIMLGKMVFSLFAAAGTGIQTSIMKPKVADLGPMSTVSSTSTGNQ